MKKRLSKLTQEMARQIKELLACGFYYQHQIAALRGVNQGHMPLF